MDSRDGHCPQYVTKLVNLYFFLYTNSPCAKRVWGLLLASQPQTKVAAKSQSQHHTKYSRQLFLCSCWWLNMSFATFQLFLSFWQCFFYQHGYWRHILIRDNTRSPKVSLWSVFHCTKLWPHWRCFVILLVLEGIKVLKVVLFHGLRALVAFRDFLRYWRLYNWSDLAGPNPPIISETSLLYGEPFFLILFSSMASTVRR